MSSGQQYGGWAPPNQPPQPGYYPPTNAQPQQPYPPQQQQQWGPPPSQHNQPSQQQWAQPPQQQGQWGQQPLQQSYNYASSSQQSWTVPPVGQYQQTPQQGQYSATAPGQHGSATQHGGPTHPYGADPKSDAIRIHEAISKSNPSTREYLEFIKTIGAVQNDYQMSFLRQTYQGMYGRDLLELVRDKRQGDYEELCEILIRPQPERDAYFIHKAIDRAGTSEDLLNDVVLGRTKEDIASMKATYSRLYGRDMVTAVRSDLSMKTEQLFTLVLDDRAYGDKEQARWMPQNVQRDAQDLHSVLHASKGGLLGGRGVDIHGVITIMAQRAPGQLRALDQEYTRRSWSLEKDLREKFKDHMRDALLLMLKRDTNVGNAEAGQLERAMKGVGTHEALLTNATVRAHWQRQTDVSNAFRQSTGKDLKQRISGETSGKYRELLLELLYPSTKVGQF